MKPPILRVKKNATIYDDDAPSRTHPEVRAAWRARKAAEEEASQRKGPGGRRAVLAVLVIAAGLFLVWSLLPRSYSDRSTVGGWQAILRATLSSDTLIVGVTFIATPKAVANAGTEIDFTVTGTDVHRAASQSLEKSPMTIREDIPFLAGMKVVHATVRIGNESATIVTGIPGS